MRPSKDELFMAIAHFAAERSHCRKAQVGCVLTDWAGESVSLGYNGLAAGGDNDCGVSEGPCDCVHAEANALAKSNRPRGALVAYVTLPPCGACASMLVNAGVRRVVVPRAKVGETRTWEWMEKWQRGHRILLTCGVLYEFLDPYETLTNGAS
jgi:dCMP deaminase